MIQRFDLDPMVNWPTPDEFKIIRQLQDEGLIVETYPTPEAWHFDIVDQRALERLPKICLELSHSA